MLVSALSACDDLRFPRDPEGTLESVLADDEMTVAVSDNPPWVTTQGAGEPGGTEVELVKALADELGVGIEWRRLDAFAALESLERDDVDLAIGGFDRTAVMPVPGAAPSYTFFEEDFVIGAQPGAALPIEGQKVFVPRDTPLAQLVRDRGGVPVDQWTDDVAFAAVPRWQLVALDLTPTDIVLHRAQHVVAVQQGENGWLFKLERLFRRETSNLGERLRANQR